MKIRLSANYSYLQHSSLDSKPTPTTEKRIFLANAYLFQRAPRKLQHQRGSKTSSGANDERNKDRKTTRWADRR